MKGRKIHSLVDTSPLASPTRYACWSLKPAPLGLPIRLVVHSAGIQDRDGAALVFDKVKRRFPWLECIFADTGYNAQQTYEVACDNALRLEIVPRNPHAAGFEVIKRRWVASPAPRPILPRARSGRPWILLMGWGRSSGRAPPMLLSCHPKSARS